MGLSWTASTDDVSVDSYDVFRDGVRLGTTSTTSYTDDTAAPGRTHSYAVIARDAGGNLSERSAEVSDR